MINLTAVSAGTFKTDTSFPVIAAVLTVECLKKDTVLNLLSMLSFF